LVRKAVQGCIAIDGHQEVLPPLPAAVVTKIADMITAFVPEMPNDENPASWKSCFLVESAGETLVVFKLENTVEVFKVGMDGNALEQVNSIGSRAIFISSCGRGLCLDADKFPSIEANFIYFTNHLASPSINMYHLKDGQQGQGASATEDVPSVDLPALLEIITSDAGTASCALSSLRVVYVGS
jgi:hypothetical protein